MKEREGKKDKERGGRETGKIHEEREEEGKERERDKIMKGEGGK